MPQATLAHLFILCYIHHGHNPSRHATLAIRRLHWCYLLLPASHQPACVDGPRVLGPQLLPLQCRANSEAQNTSGSREAGRSGASCPAAPPVARPPHLHKKGVRHAAMVQDFACRGAGGTFQPHLLPAGHSAASDHTVGSARWLTRQGEPVHAGNTLDVDDPANLQRDGSHASRASSL